MSEMSMAMSSSQNNNEDENAYLDTTEEDVGEDEDEEIEDKYLSIADDDNSKNEFENEDDDNDYDDDELMDYKKPNSSSSNNNNNNNGNTNGKRRTVYDKSNLDTAVDLVLRNKLSLRAASHIYNIPFSSLRTRKIFVENQCASGSKMARKLMGKKTPTIRDIYDIDNNDAEDDAQNCFNNVPFNHNKQSDGSKRQKIDAIRSSELETSNTRSGKPSKIVYSPVMPSTKRLYIKHERLLMMLGARQQQQEQHNTTDHKKLPEREKTSSTHSNSKLKNEPASSETTTNTPTAKKSNSPFKLSSILSSTTLSMKNKTQIKQQQQQQQHQQQQTPNYNTTKINVLLKLNEANSLNGKGQNSSIAASQETLQSTSEITPAPKRTSPFECSRCSLQFVNRAHLNEHENESQCSSTESSTQTLYANVCEISSHEQSKLFKCSFCDCLAYDKLSFLSHTNFCTRKSNSCA